MIPGQMFLMDRFFDGTFLTFGIEVISFAERDQEDRIDPMVRHYCQAQAQPRPNIDLSNLFLQAPALRARPVSKLILCSLLCVVCRPSLFLGI